MNPSETERLAVLETKVDAIDERTRKMDEKLDTAISCKADKTELETVQQTQVDHDRAINRLYGALAFIAVAVPVVLWLIERAFS